MAERRTTSVRGRQLARTLKRLREIDGRTGEEAADALGWSGAKISRIENAVTAVKATDLRKMLDLYEVHGEQRDTLLRLARRTGERSWWDAQPELGAPYTTYLELEAEAENLRCYSALTFHGLLQTEDYARAVIAANRNLSPQTVEGRVQARMRRQRRLLEDPPPVLHVIVDEAALRRPVGGAEVMRAQVAHLAEQARRPNVTIQLLPFSVGVHPALAGPFIMMGFAAPANPVVYLEHQSGGFYTEADADLVKYGIIFEDLERLSLASRESLVHLDQAAGAA